MAVNDVKILRNAGESRQYKVDDRNTGNVARTIKAGEPVKASGNYVVRIADDDPTIAADILIGVASITSDETATANGVVDVLTLRAGQTVLEAAATTVANVDTAAELLTYLNNYILFDASATIYNTTTDGVITIDENATSDPNVNGLILIDGSADARGLCRVVVHINATEAGSLVGQTMD